MKCLGLGVSDISFSTSCSLGSLWTNVIVETLFIIISKHALGCLGLFFDFLPFLCLYVLCKNDKGRGLMPSKILKYRSAGGYIYMCCATYLLILFSDFNFEEKWSDMTDFHS